MSRVGPEAERPYDTYPNVVGISLSYGEINDFNHFQDWLKQKLHQAPQSKGQFHGHLGEAAVIVKSATDPSDPERRVPQIVINPSELVETRYTLTSRGLLRETFLPGETEPDKDILEGEKAAAVLNSFKVGFKI